MATDFASPEQKWDLIAYFSIAYRSRALNEGSLGLRLSKGTAKVEVLYPQYPEICPSPLFKFALSAKYDQKPRNRAPPFAACSFFSYI
jgi:hypothetical protein